MDNYRCPWRMKGDTGACSTGGNLPCPGAHFTAARRVTLAAPAGGLVHNPLQASPTATARLTA